MSDDEVLPEKLFYVRGIIRNRLNDLGFYGHIQAGHWLNPAIKELLAHALRCGKNIEEIETLVIRMPKSAAWAKYRDAIMDFASPDWRNEEPN